MTRCYNFCAGPASLPEPVLEIARDDMLDWHGKGLSLMEMSHRSDEVVGVAQHAEQTLRSLLGIPQGLVGLAHLEDEFGLGAGLLLHGVSLLVQFDGVEVEALLERIIRFFRQLPLGCCRAYEQDADEQACKEFP